MAPEASLSATVMEGGGAYNRNSSLQSACIGSALDFLMRCAERVPVDETDTRLVIADYGASQGRNSMAPIAAAIKVLRRRAGQSRPIAVVHNDQPTNDFTSLFEVVENDPASYLQGNPLVFPSVVGRSFYGPVLPPESVTLGWCANAAHWLSHVPPAPPDSLTWQSTAFPDIRAAFERQASEDWSSFLRHRGAELRPGGRLVVILAAAPDGDLGWGPVGRHVDAELDILIQRGVVTAEDLARMVNPVALRSRAELTAPFGTDGVCAGLAIEHLDIGPAPDPFWAEYQRSGDALVFGKSWAAMLRVTSFPSLASVLAPEKRLAFLDLVEAGIAARFAAAPEPISTWFARMVLAKMVG